MTPSNSGSCAIETATLQTAKELFNREGFVLTAPIVPADVIERAVVGMDAVLAGEYETGVEPRTRLWNPGDDPQALRKVDMPHVCNRAVAELIKHASIGEWAAALIGAQTVHVWAVQLLYKPPGGRRISQAGSARVRDPRAQYGASLARDSQEHAGGHGRDFLTGGW